ncbi:MAG: branched-chain amino acid ABC transporter permease [Desulfitobacteriaceae bacterium]|nr:branched-chain amino acid ABC transporter permease [Desulfitobacteriaceae bacterium]
MKNEIKMNRIKKLVALLLAFGVVQLLVSVGILNDYIMATVSTIGINIILAVSLNLITGFTGQFSLGHAGFMSIGAYTCAIITLRNPTTSGFVAGVFAGALMAALVGFVVGLPTLRLRGDYLAIATLGMAEIIRIVFLNLDITNGAAGLSNIPEFTNWMWLFIFTSGTVLIITNFINSSHGRACISIREDEIAADAMGINITKYKVTAFVIGAFFAGIAGALYASRFYVLKPDAFGFLKSIDILVIVVLGGLGSISGSIIAAILLAIITSYLQSFPEIRMVIYSVTLIAIMLFRPQGLMGSEELSKSMFKKWGRLLNRKDGGVA